MGVVDGFGGGHCCPGAGTGVEGVRAERVAEVIDRRSKPVGLVGDWVVGRGAVEGGGDLWLPGPVEEHRQVGEHPPQARDVPGLVERVDACGEHVDGQVDVAVGGFEPGRLHGEDRFQERELVLAGVGESFTEDPERPARVGRSTCPDPVRSDQPGPYRVPVRDGLVGLVVAV